MNLNAIHHIAMENLRMIREQGMEAFLEQEAKLWTCLHYGKPFSVHDMHCPHCGKKIRG